MNVLEQKYMLSNGVEIPKLGLGTWMINDHDVVQAVKIAIGIGYRHVDTAQAYGNERGVGEAIKAGGVPRRKLFITTKLAAEIKSYREAVFAIDESLRKMDLDYIDLMIIHSPQPWREFGGPNRYVEGNREAWRALEEAYKAGKLRSIGVSNFQKADIDGLFEFSSVKPMVNQILVHISSTPTELIDYSQKKGMLVEAYSPMAHGELMKNQKVKSIADKYGVSIAQLSIRYTLELGLLPLPKTMNPTHMKNNAEVDFRISADDLNFLKNVDLIRDYGDHSKFPVFRGSHST